MTSCYAVKHLFLEVVKMWVCLTCLCSQACCTVAECGTVVILSAGVLYVTPSGKPNADATGVPGVPPAVSREQPENYVNLRDPWARVYLARGCAAAIQSGYIAGGISLVIFCQCHTGWCKSAT